ncbi:hypothetical protein J7384_03325 [Endozoicomonas sp. G2_1]|uniref:hypothetical protein n=1 Tax=Endozoicomonas sp. G2_1 TaxID=2821091 RepID=UPI001AD99556|nr:hypothetical protein [Endozoicomonas sp. G2_1]MBO9489385.1 hypothetical protein [Endozoicomonas sp. G2_1]
MLELWSNTISQLQRYIGNLGYTPLVHFELEGCYQTKSADLKLDYSKINRQLKALNIDGELVSEYWQQQWEYVSIFAGQTPLKEAQNLDCAIRYLPELLAQQGVDKTLIKPVVWAGDKGKLASGSKNIFTSDTRDVHIPNAIQLNVSVLDQAGNNLVADANFGECLQQCFIDTSLANCLLYLPEQEAFERFALKTRYGLADELCSPNDISGGHQGSVALYRELGKHNQKMGEQALLYDHQQNVLVAEHHWQKTARVEHRLGAASEAYNPYLNVIYALLNLIDALHVYRQNEGRQDPEIDNTKNLNQQLLPNSLYDVTISGVTELGAISLFEQSDWFSDSIDAIVKLDTPSQVAGSSYGKQIKRTLLAQYQASIIVA